MSHQHIPLVTASPSWLEKPIFFTEHLDTRSDACPKCQEYARIRSDFTDLYAIHKSTLNDLQAHQKVMLDLQTQIRRVAESTSRLMQQLTDPAISHQRCGLCYQLTGRGHPCEDLQREPYGTALVCDDCASRLKRRKTSVSPVNVDPRNG